MRPCCGLLDWGNRSDTQIKVAVAGRGQAVVVPPVRRTAVCVADSLALELDEVSFTSRLIPDLGAYSLDFVDIIFMLEKKFGVKIQEGDLDFMARLDISSPDVMRDGFLTQESVEKLKPNFYNYEGSSVCEAA